MREEDSSGPGTLVRWVVRLPSWLIILPIRGYQLGISPLIGPRCRFEPTCSQYFIDAVKKYGVVIGSLKGVWRILRCNPWCQGGYDPP
ncbi:MAG: membrane protein insertion efficiency factor YidD [Planctomycetia bacterium]|nr:membrane protein insertion efficiency factor YidD [Planctomycetia bacterium]